VFRKVISAQVGVSQHHVHGRPAAEFLQHVQRRPGLYMPECPRMAQIVPAEILDPGPLERLGPSVIVGTGDGLPLVNKSANPSLCGWCSGCCESSPASGSPSPAQRRY
jgi:hypothetical protein